MPKWASRGPQINPTPHVYLQISATPSAAHTVLTNGIVRNRPLALVLECLIGCKKYLLPFARKGSIPEIAL